MKAKFVWQFTNKRKLTAGEFTNYFERKVLSTIRKYKMPIQKINSENIKAKIINSIIKTLPERKGKTSLESLDNTSNTILYIIMHKNKDKLKSIFPKAQPLYLLSDKEILLYSKIKKIKGKLETPKGKLKEIDSFIKTIEAKNPDIRHNIVRALLNSDIL